MGESITTTFLLSCVFLWFLAIHPGCEATSIAKLDRCTDRSDTPHFCVHNLMCYGHDQYCDPAEDKIQACLPAENTLEWCIHNYQNALAMPNFQCRYACFVRFNMTQLEPRSPEGDAVPSTQSPVVCNDTTTQKVSRSSEEDSSSVTIPYWGLLLLVIPYCVHLVYWIYSNREKCKKTNKERSSLKTDTTIYRPVKTNTTIYRPVNQDQHEVADLAKLRSAAKLQERQNNRPERDIPQGRGDANSTETSESSGFDSSSQANGSFSTNDGKHQENENSGPYGQSSSATQVNTPTISRGVPTILPQQDGTSLGRMVPSGEQYNNGRLQ